MEENKRKKLFDVEEQMEHDLDEQAFTRAVSRLSDTDRHLFEDTGVIHIDRDMPAETQTLHVISLSRKHQQKRNFVFRIILCLLVAGILIGAVGIGMHMVIVNDAQKQDQIQQADNVRIDANSFPDDLFRSHIAGRYDVNQDGYLDGQERDNVLIIIVPSEPAITTVTGIEWFSHLQSLTVSGTSITQLDLSANPELSFLDVSNTPVETLNLQKQEKLVDVRAENTPALKEVYMPSNSMIHTFDTDGSSLICECDASGNYIGCSFRQG